jgi:PAS domain S-box-containing protein
MTAYTSESGVSRQDIETALQALSLSKTEIVPLLALRPAEGDQPTRLVFANPAMLDLLRVKEVAEASTRLRDSRDPGARRLADLAQYLAVDTGPRLERLRFFFGPVAETVTFLCRKSVIGEEGPLLVAAALGTRHARQITEQHAVTPLPVAPEAPAVESHAVESPAVEAHAVDPSATEMPASDAIVAQQATHLPPVIFGANGSLLASAALSLDEVKQRLSGRITETKNVRFLWRTDADDRITEITPPLAEIVGSAAADILGRDFGDVAKFLEREPDGPLGRAIAKRETFSGIEVLWPITAAAAAVPVSLGALPAYLADHRFDGYRGFGVIRLDRLAAAEPRALPEASEPMEPMTPVYADNVIHLRPVPKPVAEAEKPVVVEPPAAAEQVPAAVPKDLLDTEKGPLSNEEETAFREIAAALSDEAAANVLHDETSIAASLGRNAAMIFDRLGMGILISRNDVPIFANRYLLDLLGFADEDAFHAAGGVGKIFDEMRTGGDTVGLRTASGQIKPVRGRLQTIDWDGLPAALLTLRAEESRSEESRAEESRGDDEKEQRSKLETELRELQTEADELTAILDTATDGIALIDAQGRILALNRSAEALFGYDQGAVQNEPFTMLLAPESHAKLRQYFEGLQSGGVASLLNDGREVLGKARQGGTIPLFLTLGRVGVANASQPQKFCALLRDMTHWKKVEDELNAARQEAERVSAAKSDFLAKVSHEIRTPLNAIIGFAEVIMEERFGAIGNDRYRDYLKDIHSSGAHVMSLVNDLLDLSKIEAGRMDLDFVAVDTNKVITECVGLMQPQANRERIIMRLALSASLPKILADERALKQIVLNLLSNAVKFNEPGGQVIVATAIADDGQAVIRIRDTGIGMSDDDIETALEPFRQLATARQSAGTGLGLPLTKALVEANRASFTIKSKKNEGTLVEIAFPPARLLSRDPLSA